MNFGSASTSGGSSPFGQATSGSTGGLFVHWRGRSLHRLIRFIFGSTPAPAATGSLFGAQKPAASGGAFSFTNPGQTPGQQSSSPIFGSGAATPNKPADSAQAQKPSGLFGAGNTTTGSSNLFGSTTPATTKSGLFGNISTTPAGPPPQTQPNAQKLPSFGQQTSAPSALFGNARTSSPLSATTPAVSSPAFGANASTGQQQTKPAGGLFGAAGSANTSTTAPGGMFANLGQPKPATDASKPSTNTPLFGAGGSTPTTTQSSGSLFTPSSGTSTQPAFSLTSASTTKPSTSLTTTSTTGGNTQGSLFSLGTPSSAAAPTATTTAPSGGLFNTPKPNGSTDSTTPATTTAAPASNMFANIRKPATTTTAPSATTTTGTTGTTASSAPAVTATASAPTTTKPGTTTATTTGTNLGASTVGPAPPAQSRLKNKTMDEIITRWATDLTKYQKEFQEQAEQVAEWDRMLVENSTKVQKLYGNTVDAERATQEVERQLASVESQQDELSSWLDRYEQEVETLLSKQVGTGDNLPGPDQERARTYKLAERLSERLNEMGQDLTSMIEEVNTASATLSKTSKADEPISQIVRILNSHLSQLQLIDQGTAALRAKITASQKLGNSMSTFKNGTPRIAGSGSGGAAEDFYRSYMGRR
ncbi:nucleoporin Nsp1 [Trichophyton equinum CBS 127.97]|uniref:Nucleoporin NSP1 n=1 Tax=Trichophyton equinum (strain ATCC MYA-4606 / CBS 127.97) TaxID=559882 RepID=F2PI56_TRIEC|nr:nucleoporin Nsp1 [Trichophyton equinum CBS 127.97]